MKLHLNWVIFAILVLNCMELTRSAPTLAETDLQTDEEETFLRSFAERMKSLMNTSVDPCDNFYKYACGNYPNVIEDLETSYKRWNSIDVIFLLYDKVDAILKKVRDPSEEYYEELQIAKKFVNTCANANLFPIEPSEEYLEVIKAIGGFPAIDPKWNESSFDWFNMTAHLKRYGVIGFVEDTILPIYPFYPFYKIPKLGFGFNVYLENIATNKSDGYIYNEKIMRDLLQVYNVSGASADKVIEGVFQLWKDIIEIQPAWIDEDFIRDKCLWLSAEDNLKPFKKWINLFSIAWDVRRFNVSFESYCPCNWFYSKLDALAEKNPKAFANYMALKFLFNMHPQIKSTKFQRRECIAIVKDAMPTIFSHFFMKEHYNKEDNYDISEMIFELKTSLKYLINTTDWLDDSAQNEALEKLKNLRSRIGQVVDPITDVYIKQIRSLNATANMALNTIQLAKFKTDMRHYGHLHQNGNKKTKTYEILDAVNINAFYGTWENSINVMGGLLYPPIYHKDFPIAVKYGSLGYIIGHEIGHGFVDRGFGTTSNLTHRMWLSKKSMAIAKQRSRCFEDDYNNFKEPAFNQKFNGKKVLSEIEADSVGLRQAFEAYRRVMKYDVKQRSDEFQRRDYLSGLSMSQEQMFFLAFAQLYCSIYEPKHYWAELSGKHPVNRYRVMGTLRNFDEFSNTFNCPTGSPMNPSQKCRLW